MTRKTRQTRTVEDVLTPEQREEVLKQRELFWQRIQKEREALEPFTTRQIIERLSPSLRANSSEALKSVDELDLRKELEWRADEPPWDDEAFDWLVVNGRLR